MKRLDIPPVWLALCALAAWMLARWLPLWRVGGALDGAFGEALDAAGELLGALGFLMVAWSAWWFWRRRTPIEPRRKARALITEGPYRINRNPIYTGLALALLGWALWLGALSALIPVALFPLIITRRFILGEEEGLRMEFGEGAARWFAESRRW